MAGACDAGEVLLASETGDGAHVQLQVERYQFPEMVTGGPRDWDANWLVIRGDVHSADGETWSFSDPCLTSWEARDLITWLRTAAEGRATSTRDPADAEQLLSFTEPNIAFGIAPPSKDAVVVRVFFSLESGPPSLGKSESAIWDFFIPVTIAPDSLRAAATSWEDELAAYPVR